MRRRALGIALSGALLAVLISILVKHTNASTGSASVTVLRTPPPADPGADAVAVLVELFTSEGCSSCPPADAVLAGLERTQSVAGVRVVPLGFHVSYWDRLGWPDPFSSEASSDRQRRYASLGEGAYTPQAVVDGRSQLVGSRRAALEAAIADAATRPHASIVIGRPKGDGPGSTVAISVNVGRLPVGASADVETVLVLTENAVRVAVPRGENGGRTLEHTAVVRDVVVSGVCPPEGGVFSAVLKVPTGVDERDLRVVTFVQERTRRRVLGTATRSLL